MNESLLLRARARAEEFMTDKCKITVNTGETTLDPETGQLVPVPSTVYEGKCKFQSAGAGSTPEAGGFQHTVVRNEVHIPFGVVAVPEGAVVECLESGNPQLVGERFRVTGFAVESYATAARLPVERHV